MDTDAACGHDAEDDAEFVRRGRVLAWSMARLIQLLDDAIDSAGAQLARSAGLWDDTPSEAPARVRSRRPRRDALGSQTSSVEPLLEEGRTELELP
jgi:hypothetical protein